MFQILSRWNSVDALLDVDVDDLGLHVFSFTMAGNMCNDHHEHTPPTNVDPFQKHHPETDHGHNDVSATCTDPFC